MKVLTRLVHLMEPDRNEEFARAEAGAAEARNLLAQVIRRGSAVRSIVTAHRVDRIHNHYGERIRRALEGGNA